MQVILNCSAFSLETFIIHNVEPGSTIATDSWKSYNFIDNFQCIHEKSNQSVSKNNQSLYAVHLLTTLIKKLIRSTFQGRFDPKYFQKYLDEYTFRFNRRNSKSIGKIFMSMVQQVVKSVKITNSDIIWNIDPISEYYCT